MGNAVPPGTKINGWTMLVGNSQADVDWATNHPKPSGTASREVLEKNNWFQGNTQSNVPSTWINTPLAARTSAAPPPPLAARAAVGGAAFDETMPTGSRPVSMGVLRGRTLRPEAQDYLVQQWQEEQDKAQEEFWNSDEFKALVAEAEATKPGQEPTLSQGDPFKGVVGTAAPRTTTPPAIATLNDLFKFKPPAKDYKPYTPSANIGFAEPGMSLAAQSTLNFLQTKPAEFLPGQYL